MDYGLDCFTRLYKVKYDMDCDYLYVVELRSLMLRLIEMLMD